MAIANVSGPGNFGRIGTTITMNGTASVASGDLHIASAVYVASASMAAPAGWTLLIHMGPTGASSVRISVFAKIASVAGLTNYAFTEATMTQGIGEFRTLRKAGDAAWEIGFTSGSDASLGLSYDVTSGALATIAADVVFVSSTSSASNTASAFSLAQSGATFSTFIAGNSTFTGFSSGVSESSFTVSGTGTGAFTYHLTLSANNAIGDSVFIRVRELAAPLIPTPTNVPVITLVSPAPGLIGVSDAITIDVTDPDGNLSNFIPVFTMPTAVLNETAHTWPGTFDVHYIASSSRTAITNGFRYVFVRTGGWVDAVLSFSGLAFDASGNQVSAAFAWTTAFAAPAPTPDSIGTPKLEARIRVPVGGWTVTTVDTNGSVVRTFPAGDYYLNSVAPGGTVTFLAQLAATLTAGSVTYTAVCDDNLDTSTGRITIAASGSFSLTWTNNVLRDLLGFTGGSTATVTTVSGAYHARYLWLPNLRRLPETPEPLYGEATQDFGRPEADYIMTMAPSGATTQSVFSQRWKDVLVFEPLLGKKAKISNEVIVNESFEKFWRDVMTAGGVPWRYHSNRADDVSYWTQVFDTDGADLRMGPTIQGWVGVLSHWHLEFGCRKYMPLLVNGVYE